MKMVIKNINNTPGIKNPTISQVNSFNAVIKSDAFILSK